MNLNQAHKKAAMNQAIKNMERQIDLGNYEHKKYMMILALHRKYGYVAQKCADVVEFLESLWKAHDHDKSLHYANIKQTVRDEVGYIEEEDGTYKISKNGKKTKLYPKEE